MCALQVIPSFYGPIVMREEWEYAGFADRFGADFIDGIIATLVAVGAYFIVDRWLLGGDTGFLDDDAFGATEVVLLAWFLWHLTYLVGKTGQSWGRKVAGIRVVNSEGESIGFWRALGRNLFAVYISALPLYLGFFWVIWDRHKQAWHDKVFRTFVVRHLAP